MAVDNGGGGGGDEGGPDPLSPSPPSSLFRAISIFNAEQTEEQKMGPTQTRMERERERMLCRDPNQLR